MRVDELRKRERELKEEIARLERTDATSLELYKLKEERLSVRTRLRALSPKRHIGARKTSFDDEFGAVSWAIVENWERNEWAEETPPTWEDIGKIADALPPKEKIYLMEKAEGKTASEIAKAHGVKPSTVTRALKHAQELTENAREAQKTARRLKKGKLLDLSDKKSAAALLAAMTPTQAAYIYLYYAEWLTVREIGALVGRDQSSVSRGIKRGLRSIGTALGMDEIYLSNMSALDELAYEIYGRMDESELTSPELKELRARARQQYSGTRAKETIPPSKVENGGAIKETRNGRLIVFWGDEKPGHGKLWVALTEKMQREGATGAETWKWIIGIFKRLSGNVKNGTKRLLRRMRK